MDNVCSKPICTWTKNWFELDDIATNILSRLPVKSLMRCKSVSKQWLRLISSPDFVWSQLSWSRKNPSLIFFLRYEKELIKIEGENFTEISLPGGQRPRNCDMICSFNGLICLTSCNESNQNVSVWNPATQQVLSLPTATPSKKPPKIGVASWPGRYKIFRIFQAAGKPRPGRCECEVYSSITGSWKALGSVSCRPMSSKHVSIDGTLYWFVGAETNRTVADSILSADWEDNFRKISLPEEIITRHLFLVDLEGCLSLISIDIAANRFELWVLENSSSNDSVWIKKCSDDMPTLEIGYVFSVAVVGKKEILFTLMERYFVYNICSRSWREELGWGEVLRRRYSTPFEFTESLLPCQSQKLVLPSSSS